MGWVLDSSQEVGVSLCVIREFNTISVLFFSRKNKFKRVGILWQKDNDKAVESSVSEHRTKEVNITDSYKVVNELVRNACPVPVVLIAPWSAETSMCSFAQHPHFIISAHQGTAAEAKQNAKTLNTRRNSVQTPLASGTFIKC